MNKTTTKILPVALAAILLAGSAMGQVLLPPSIAKQFGAATVALNGSTTLLITVTNPNPVGALTAITFTDTLPAGIVVSTPNGLASTCSGAVTAVAGSGSVALAATTLAATESCTVQVNITGIAAGVNNNAVSVTDATAGAGNTATASITVVAPATLGKAFGVPSIDIDAVTTLTFTLANPNAGTALTGVNFTDALPAGLAVATPNGLPNGTCGGTETAAGVNVSVSNVTLAASASCTFSVNVIGVAAGVQVNTTTAIGSVEGGTGTTATATILVNPVVADIGVYQLRYLANLDKGDSYVNLTNAGTLAGFDPAGRLCVNVYTFDPAEELISCCACPVTPNGLNSLSARNDLISNTLTPGVPTSITVKLVANLPGAGGVCNASTPTVPTLVRGMRAWATTIHLNTSGSPAVGYQETATPFTTAELSLTELSKLTSFCGFIQANGSGFGICKSCRAGALGASQQ